MCFSKRRAGPACQPVRRPSSSSAGAGAAAVTDRTDALAARIAAVEQRLVVAVLQGDDQGRRHARGEITRLKQQLLSAQAGSGGSMHPAHWTVAER